MLFFLNLDGTVTRSDTDHVYQGQNKVANVELFTLISPAQAAIQVAFTLPNGLTTTYAPMSYVGAYSVDESNQKQVHRWKLAVPYNVTEVEGQVGVSFNVLLNDGTSGQTLETINQTTYTSSFAVEYSALPIPPTTATESELEQLLELLNLYYTQNASLAAKQPFVVGEVNTNTLGANQQASVAVEQSAVADGNGNYPTNFTFSIPKGPKGETGSQGPQGETGPQGPQGPKGPKGATGATGATGAQGPIGPRGPQGVQGNPGPKGDPGQSFQVVGILDSTSALPTPTEETRNQAYLVPDTTEPGTYDLYVITGTDTLVWENAGHIESVQGPKGDVGPQGPQGAQGPQGPTGPQGPQGVNGIDGTDYLFYYGSDIFAPLEPSFQRSLELSNFNRTPVVGDYGIMIVNSTGNSYIQVFNVTSIGETTCNVTGVMYSRLTRRYYACNTTTPKVPVVGNAISKTKEPESNPLYEVKKDDLMVALDTADIDGNVYLVLADIRSITELTDGSGRLTVTAMIQAVTKINSADLATVATSGSYNDLANIPVINQDLSASGFTPVANTYYRHTGTGGGTPIPFSGGETSFSDATGVYINKNLNPLAIKNAMAEVGSSDISAEFRTDSESITLYVMNSNGVLVMLISGTLTPIYSETAIEIEGIQFVGGFENISENGDIAGFAPTGSYIDTDKTQIFELFVAKTPFTSGSAYTTGAIYYYNGTEYKAITGETKTLDYNQIENIPVINQDLSASGFTPVANTYYRHTGATTDTFTQGVIYLYDTAYHKLGESGGGGISDVQVNGTSVVTDGVANIPPASTRVNGVVTTEAQTITGIKTFLPNKSYSDRGLVLDWQSSGSYPYLRPKTGYSGMLGNATYPFNGVFSSTVTVLNRVFTPEITRYGGSNIINVPDYTGTMMVAPSTWSSGTSGSLTLTENGTYQFYAGSATKTNYTLLYVELGKESIAYAGKNAQLEIDTNNVVHVYDMSQAEPAELTVTLYYRRIGI